MRVSLVGMGCGATGLTNVGARALETADLVVGAARLLADLPPTCVRRVVASRPEDVATAIAASTSTADHAVVLLSGDTGFHSAATLTAELLAAEGLDVEIVPGISSVQLLAARLGRPWQDWRLLSAHGQTCDIVAELCHGAPVFLLTSGAGSVGEVCSELVVAGLGEATVTVGERLGYPDERLTSGAACDMARSGYGALNVLLVELPAELVPKRRAPGIPDDEFVRARVPMTKQEVRAVALAKLAVTPDDVCWDVGAGTGAVSVELSLAARSTWAIERESDAVELIRQNRLRHRAWKLRVVKGEAPAALEDLPVPDVVFVGGSGGRLADILNAAVAANSCVRICVTAIALETLELARCWMGEHGFAIEITQLAVGRTRQSGSHHLLLANNPVFLVVGTRADWEMRP